MGPWALNWAHFFLSPPGPVRPDVRHVLATCPLGLPNAHDDHRGTHVLTAEEYNSNSIIQSKHNYQNAP